MTAPRSRCRQPRQLDAGIFQAEISSFRLHLAAEGSSGPANLATIRAAIIATTKDAGYLHIPERPPRPHHPRRDPPPPRPRVGRQRTFTERRSPVVPGRLAGFFWHFIYFCVTVGRPGGPGRPISLGQISVGPATRLCYCSSSIFRARQLIWERIRR
jgi:hypothetical protein